MYSLLQDIRKDLQFTVDRNKLVYNPYVTTLVITLETIFYSLSAFLLVVLIVLFSTDNDAILKTLFPNVYQILTIDQLGEISEFIFGSKVLVFTLSFIPNLFIAVLLSKARVKRRRIRRLIDMNKKHIVSIDATK